MLNVMPWREIYFKRKSLEFFIIALTIGVMTFIGLFGLRFIYSYQVEKMHLLKKSLQNYIQDQQLQKLHILEFLRKQSVLKKHYVMLVKQKILANVLREVSDALPNNSRLISVVYDQKGLLLEGILLGGNYKVIKDFEIAIHKKLNLNTKTFQIKPLGPQKIIYKIFISFPEIKI